MKRKIDGGQGEERDVGNAKEEKRKEDKEKDISKDKNYWRKTNGGKREKNKEGEMEDKMESTGRRT
jgi:hypothetical protein